MQIPIFPLRTVLLPGGRLPLQIFEPRYLAMTRRCLEDDAPFGVCLILDGREAGVPAVPHAVGCLARIVDMQAPAPERYMLLTVGETPFRIIQRGLQPDGLLVAEVTVLADVPMVPPAARHAPLVEGLKRLIAEAGSTAVVPPVRLDDAGWVARRLAERLPIASAALQRLLESGDGLEQLDLVAKALKVLRQSGRS